MHFFFLVWKGFIYKVCRPNIQYIFLLKYEAVAKVQIAMTDWEYDDDTY